MSNIVKLDAVDREILFQLQLDGRLTNVELARRVGLTPPPCLRRVKRLEDAGIITGYRAVIDITHLSRPVNIFAEIILTKLAQRALVEKRLAAMHEVVECWEVTGATDYLARFICPDLSVYEALTTRLIDDPGLGVSRIVSHVALRTVRRFTGYPESLLAGK